MSGIPGKRIVVLSPHLDDAVLSLGASIADAAATGADVAIVTAFAGDPARQGDPSVWDRRAGFSSSLEAIEARREEDRLACTAIGARPVWLPFGYGGVAVDERDLGKQLGEAVRDCRYRPRSGLAAQESRARSAHAARTSDRDQFANARLVR